MILIHEFMQKKGPYTFDYSFEWTNPAIWEDGIIPSEGDFAVIPADMGVILDSTDSMNDGALKLLMLQGNVWPQL